MIVLYVVYRRSYFCALALNRSLELMHEISTPDGTTQMTSWVVSSHVEALTNDLRHPVMVMREQSCRSPY